MPECRHSFHGYSRSKDFINTLKNCFESATCTSRPWTTAYTKPDTLSGTVCDLVMLHTNKYGDVDMFRFADTYNNGTNNMWGQLRFYLYPKSTLSIIPGHPDGDLKSAISITPYINMWYHGTQLEDSDVLPNYVWYWLWVDDDCFTLRVMGNVGGEGTAASASEWMHYGSASAREDDVYEFPDPKYVVISESQLWQETGTMYQMLDKKALGPHYWYNPIGTAITPTTKLEIPVTEYAMPSLAPVMTSNTAPSGTCRASTTYTDGSAYYQPYYAFKQGAQIGVYKWQATTQTGWLEYEFPSATTITEYSVETHSPAATNSWTFSGSNDGITYTPLDIKTNQFVEGDRAIRIQLNAHVTYKIYRIAVTALAGNRAAVLSLSFGTHTQPSLLYTGATPLLTTTSAAAWNSRVYIGRTAFVNSNSIKCVVAQKDVTGAPKYITNGDIVAMEEEHADYSYHNATDSYDSGSGAGPNYYCLIKRAECPYNLTAAQNGIGAIKLTWTNPNKLKGIKIVRSETNHYITRITDGMVVFDSTAISPNTDSTIIDSGLSSGATYFYAVFSYDSSGVHSTPVRSGRVEATAL